MGQNTTLHDTTETAGNSRRRFTRYFPRLFAYLRAMTGNESTARDAAASAFEATLAEAADDENEFTTALFAAGRVLCPAAGVAGDGLSDMEREVISLTFDAQLTRAQVAELLGTDADAVVKALLSGLRRLRDESAADTGLRAVHGLPA
jgi:DNA-directed RNA polymerase specialized sigma24 family protein